MRGQYELAQVGVAVMIVTCIPAVLSSNHLRTLTIFANILLGFPQSLQVHDVIVPQVG
jgi:hypothetical protein